MTNVEEVTATYIQNLLTIIKNQSQTIKECKEEIEKRVSEKHFLFVVAAVNDRGYLFFNGARTSFEEAIEHLVGATGTSEKNKLASEISSFNGHYCNKTKTTYKLFKFETSLPEMEKGSELDSKSELGLLSLERAYYEMKTEKQDLEKKIEKLQNSGSKKSPSRINSKLIQNLVKHNSGNWILDDGSRLVSRLVFSPPSKSGNQHWICIGTLVDFEEDYDYNGEPLQYVFPLTIKDLEALKKANETYQSNVRSINMAGVHLNETFMEQLKKHNVYHASETD